MSLDTRPGESIEGLLKRLRKEVAKSRILSTIRRKRWFTPPPPRKAPNAAFVLPLIARRGWQQPHDR